MLLIDLFEARVANLYHGTNALSAARIIRDDRLEPRSNHVKGNLNIQSGTQDYAQLVSGISLTRDRDFALSWGTEVVFELDQNRLRQNYRLAPIDYMSDLARPGTKKYQPHRRREEREEFVITERPIQLSRYLTGLMIDWAAYNEVKDDDEYEALINHPMLRII